MHLRSSFSGVVMEPHIKKASPSKGVIRKDATITEFIYVSNKIEDGAYILNLQIAPFENDASPSKPVLYKIMD